MVVLRKTVRHKYDLYKIFILDEDIKQAVTDYDSSEFSQSGETTPEWKSTEIITGTEQPYISDMVKRIFNVLEDPDVFGKDHKNVCVCVCVCIAWLI